MAGAAQEYRPFGSKREKRDLLGVKRDLLSVKRDLLSVKRVQAFRLQERGREKEIDIYMYI